jgi:hypothetical protein
MSVLFCSGFISFTWFCLLSAATLYRFVHPELSSREPWLRMMMLPCPMLSFGFGPRYPWCTGENPRKLQLQSIRANPHWKTRRPPYENTALFPELHQLGGAGFISRNSVYLIHKMGTSFQPVSPMNCLVSCKVLDRCSWIPLSNPGFWRHKGKRNSTRIHISGRRQWTQFVVTRMILAGCGC